MSASSDSPLYYLDHIHFDAAAGQRFVEGMSLEAFQDDLKTQYACERAIQNISEAARNLERSGKLENADFRLTDISTEIDWDAVKGIGNVMRHDYDRIRAEMVWRTVMEHLPTLQAEAHRALTRFSAFYRHES